MANGLVDITKILQELNNELKLDNDKWEKANGSINVLPDCDARIGDARIGRVGNNNISSSSEFKKPNNSKTGE